MIRFALLAVAVSAPLLAASGQAEDWTRHAVPGQGVSVDIPPHFHPDGPASAGPGVRYRAANGRSAIEVWAGPVRGERFSAETGALIAADQAEGWSITYRSETPDWAAWTGTRAGHVFHAKTVLVCNDTRTANVRLTYPAADIPRFDAIASRLGRSLAQEGPCI